MATENGAGLKGAVSLNSTVRVSQEQVHCEIGGEIVILNLNNGVYYGLDPVGSRIWSFIQTPRLVTEIRDFMLAEYEVEPARCEADLFTLLDNLLDQSLITLEEARSPQ
jgi:hypothetical protein